MNKKILILVLCLYIQNTQIVYAKNAKKSNTHKFRGRKYVLLDKVAVKVNGEVIFESDIQNLVMQHKMQYGNDNNAEFLAFKNLIMSKLLKTKGTFEVEIDENIINAYYSDKMKQLINQYGSEDMLEKVSKMPMNKLRRFIKKNVKESYKMEFIRKELSRKITVNLEEIKQYVSDYMKKKSKSKKYYQDKKVIFQRIIKHYKVTNTEKQRVIMLLKTIKQKINNGEKFESLARYYSDDKSTAQGGGDIGYFWKLENQFLPKKYMEATMNLRPIDSYPNSKHKHHFTSDIVETYEGMYIIQLLEYKKKSYRTRHIFIKFNDVEDQKKQILKSLSNIKAKIINNELPQKSVKSKFMNEMNNLKDDDRNLSGFILNNDNIWFEKNKDTLPKGLDKNVFDLKINSIIGPIYVTTEKGLAMELILLEDMTEAGELNIGRDYELIKNEILIRKQNIEMKNWIRKNMKDSIVYVDSKYDKYKEKLLQD